MVRRFRRLTQIKKNVRFYDGWLGEDDRDVQEVRRSGIIEEKWYGSLLEQYAAFLNWFKREYEGQYWDCLPMELVHTPEEYAPLSQVNSTGQGLRRLAQIRDEVKKVRRGEGREEEVERVRRGEGREEEGKKKVRS